MLRGPEHPDEFRIQVGRYGDRFYHDPLPEDDIWEEWHETVPSVSSVKRASDRDWSHVSLGRASRYLATKRHELDGMNESEIYARLNEVNKADLNRAGARGNSIHYVMECYAAGVEPDPFRITDAAEAYLPACKAFVEELKPTFLVSEAVVISRTHRYGGTMDADIGIAGRRLRVDWKTRGRDHAAYSEEGWQLAAYDAADYMIVNENGRAVRQPIPPAELVIVSLHPTGYRLYPVDRDIAVQGWLALRAFWPFKQSDRSPILKPIKIQVTAPAETAPAVDDTARQVSERQPPGTTPSPSLPGGGTVTVDDVRARLDSLEPAMRGRIRAELAARNITTGDPTAAMRVIDEIEAFEIVVPPVTTIHTAIIPTSSTAASIDEGGTATAAQLTAIETMLDNLNENSEAWVRRISKEASDAHVGISLSTRSTERRFEIARGIIKLAEDANDEMVWALLEHVIGASESPAATLGGVLGSLTLDEARRFAELAHQWVNGALYVTVTDDGRLEIHQHPSLFDDDDTAETFDRYQAGDE